MNVFMDDERDPKEILGAEASKWIVVRTIEGMMDLLRKGMVDDVSLDHDMGGKFDPEGREMNGYWLCKWMRDMNYWPKGDIRVHSKNEAGALNMISILKDREVYQQIFEEDLE